jgi:formylglycine-generating enzyme required for sulfatase activity
MGKYEVTFDEYDKYCDENEIIKPNDHGWGRGKNPVINVSWIDAVTYCNYLSEKEGLEKVYNENNWSFDITKKGYRLPTEAEWEYVASGAFKGEKTIYSWGNDNPDETKLNYNYNLNKISVVGSYPSNNEFYDLLGNVWEWCNDWKNDYSSIFKVNPVGTNSGTYRVNRGGSWNFDLDYTRSTSRGGNTPSCKLPNLGFRLCRTK